MTGEGFLVFSLYALAFTLIWSIILLLGFMLLAWLYAKVNDKRKDKENDRQAP